MNVTQTRAEQLLKKLVNQPSPTAVQNQVRETHAIIANELQQLGFQINWHRDPSGKTDDLLIAEKPSPTRKNDFVTFVSHIDTVLSVNDAGPYREGHSQIDNQAPVRLAHGAGIIDNKGGLVVLIESLREYLSETHEPPIGLRVVSSPDEETGSTAWHRLYQDIGTKSVAVLGFEPALEDGSIITSRRGNRWYNIHIQGIEAHAGRCRGEELNAAHEAATLITSLVNEVQKLKKQQGTPPGEGLSLHVGHIEGGRGKHNIVCGEVHIKLDTRFSSFHERDLIHHLVIDTLAKINRSTFEIVDDCPPFDSDAQYGDVITQLLVTLSESEGRSIQAVKAGGAGDVNHMSRPGLFIMDGLGPVGGRMHTVEEYIELESLGTRITALSRWYPALFAKL
ncbi:MAG: M20/M25/M40 family metallo-hydrolase [Bdellovibrionaceae bacterium]|nr:M20/M25/M40 family metallo-hydrolase [Pseudobdellovibrionaceae bacterium]